jgi:SAM-dependent methyltransferase
MPGASIISATVTGGLTYFDYQRRVGAEVVIPWVSRHFRVAGKRIADFGCHAGGVVDAFRAAGAAGGVGYEINADIVRASPFRSDAAFRLQVADLTSLDEPDEAFDLVVLHDVLEHVPNYGDVVAAAARHISPRGRIFVSFPPYYSMVGGHQHLAAGSARLLPYVHFLPERLFYAVADPADNEYMTRADSLADMASVRRTRLSMRRAEESFEHADLVVDAREMFILRPEYRVRYGWRTVGAGVLASVPRLRELIVNGAFYLLAKRASAASATGSTAST